MSRDVHRLGSHCYLWHKPIISIFRIFLPKVIESSFWFKLFLFAKCARAYRTWKQCQWIMRTLTCKYKTWGEKLVIFEALFKSENFTAEPLCCAILTSPQKTRNSCLRLRSCSVFGSFVVVLMSCKVNFHVVRSALQNSVCPLIVSSHYTG